MSAPPIVPRKLAIFPALLYLGKLSAIGSGVREQMPFHLKGVGRFECLRIVDDVHEKSEAVGCEGPDDGNETQPSLHKVDNVNRGEETHVGNRSKRFAKTSDQNSISIELHRKEIIDIGVVCRSKLVYWHDFSGLFNPPRHC